MVFKHLYAHRQKHSLYLTLSMAWSIPEKKKNDKIDEDVLTHAFFLSLSHLISFSLHVCVYDRDIFLFLVYFLACYLRDELMFTWKKISWFFFLVLSEQRVENLSLSMEQQQRNEAPASISTIDSSFYFCSSFVSFISIFRVKTFQ